MKNDNKVYDHKQYKHICSVKLVKNWPKQLKKFYNAASCPKVVQLTETSDLLGQCVRRQLGYF